MKSGSAKGAVAKGGTCRAAIPCAARKTLRASRTSGARDIPLDPGGSHLSHLIPLNPGESHLSHSIPPNPAYPTESHLIPANPAKACRVGRHALEPGARGDRGCGQATAVTVPGALRPSRSGYACWRRVRISHVGGGGKSPTLGNRENFFALDSLLMDRRLALSAGPAERETACGCTDGRPGRCRRFPAPRPVSAIVRPNVYPIKIGGFTGCAPA